MKRMPFTAFILLSISLFLPAAYSLAEADRYQIVIEESFYYVKPENQDKFLEIYKKNIYPFWKEMERMDLIDGDIKMFSQRVHTLSPLWTFKTIVRFTNYTAIDNWLAKREEAYNKLFADEGGYKKIRKEIDAITEAHWDEFIREIPLTE